MLFANLGQDVGFVGRYQRRLPVVMTREEVCSVCTRLEDPWKLIAQVRYGSGLRLMEAMRLRVKELDFGPGIIAIHDAKGGRYRVVGAGDVHMAESLLRKRPNACREWCWQ